MKGYLIKDLQMMRYQIKFYIMFILLAAFISGNMEEPFFAVPYLIFIGTIYIFNAIAYDETENGYSFLFTLPISRKEYVAEKYIFAAVLALISAAIGFLIMSGHMIFQNKTEDAGANLYMSILFLLLTLIFISVLLPVIFKNGVEKGRIVLSAFVGSAGGLLLILIKALPHDVQRLEHLIDAIAQMHKFSFIGIGAAICTAVIMISMQISVRIMEKKEF